MPVETPRDQAVSGFALDEVQAAVRALRMGVFREQGLSRVGDVLVPAMSPASPWVPESTERVVAVLGTAGSAGASTVALALAERSTGPARVVECCPRSASGLVAASTAELGRHPSGWIRGTRYGVALERCGADHSTPDVVPMPLPPAHASDGAPTLTVLDVGWPLSQLSHAPCWLAQALPLAHVLLLVARPTVPGMRRLESTLDLLRPITSDPSSSGRLRLAVVGPTRKKWPRGLEGSAGPATRRLLDAHSLIVIPTEPRIAHTGLDTAALPESVLESVDGVLGDVVVPGPRGVRNHDDATAAETSQVGSHS